MDNQHRKIAGYRELSQAEIDLMNKIKAEGLSLEVLVRLLRSHPGSSGTVGFDDSRPVIDQRWVSIGATHLQEGLMALTRAVAQPTFF